MKSGRDLAAEGMFEYGSRVGFWRLLRLFQERGLPMTVFGCALALERNPQAAAAIRAAGYDVCSHGWRWVKHFELTEAEEREHIRKAVASLRDDHRRAPARLVLPLRAAREHAPPRRRGGRLSLRQRLLRRRAALLGGRSPARPHLVVPYSLVNNDGKYAGWMGTSDDWFAFVRDAFDMLYEEGAHGRRR